MIPDFQTSVLARGSENTDLYSLDLNATPDDVVRLCDARVVLEEWCHMAKRTTVQHLRVGLRHHLQVDLLVPSR